MVRISKVCLGVILLIAVGEGYLRYTQHSPSPLDYMYNYIGTGHHLLDTDLGWVNAPAVINCQENGIGKETTWLNGQRASRPCVFRKKDPRRVAVLGCSYTYGFGVPDHYTYVWLLNAAHRDIVFDNYGVEDYGTQQCYQKMRQLVASEPKYDMYLYASIYDHLFRNTYNTYIPLDNDKLVMYPGVKMHAYTKRQMDYSCWPGEERLALVHYLRKLAYYHFNEISIRARENITPEMQQYCIDVYEDIVAAMSDLAKENGIEFMICALDAEGYRLTKDCPRSKEWRVIDCSLPQLPEYYNNNQLYNHPGKMGHEHYFEVIDRAIRNS